MGAPNRILWTSYVVGKVRDCVLRADAAMLPAFPDKSMALATEICAITRIEDRSILTVSISNVQGPAIDSMQIAYS